MNADLLRLTLQDPAAAARAVLAQNWPRAALWQAVVALAALGAIFTWFSLQMAPLPPDFPAFASMPLPNFVVEVIGTALMVWALYFAGRFMGGQGTPQDILTATVWLMLVRLLFKAAGVVLLAISPLLAGLFMFGTGILTLWILLHLISEAHRFASVWRALGAVALAVLAIAVGLGLLLSVLGR